MKKEIILIPFIVGIAMIIIVYIAKISEQPQPQPTPCPSEKQIILKYEKYQMFIDSMKTVKKKDVERLTDSLVKYRINE